MISFFQKIIGTGLILLSVSSNADAKTKELIINCNVSGPCKMAQATGMKKCISSIYLNLGSKGTGVESILYRPLDMTREVVMFPDTYSIKYQLTKTKPGISFVDSTGDQWGELYYVSANNLVGNITIDQDFMFKAACTVQVQN